MVENYAVISITEANCEYAKTFANGKLVYNCTETSTRLRNWSNPTSVVFLKRWNSWYYLKQTSDNLRVFNKVQFYDKMTPLDKTKSCPDTGPADGNGNGAFRKIDTNCLEYFPVSESSVSQQCTGYEQIDDSTTFCSGNKIGIALSKCALGNSVFERTDLTMGNNPLCVGRDTGDNYEFIGYYYYY